MQKHDQDPTLSPSAETLTVVGDNIKQPATKIEANEHASIDSTGSSGEDAIQYPAGFRLLLIIVALVLSTFLVALDMSIVATAIPKITDEFNSLDQVGWYASSFFLTVSAFQSFWGKLYKYFLLKPVFIASSAIFEIGSLVCATAPSSAALIVGRAIQGWGAAGLISGVYIIIAYLVTPAKRPTYTGLIGAVFGCSSVIGPLLGGVFSDHPSWRWCFYINLPIGGLAILVILIFYNTPAHVCPAQATNRERLLQLDLLGTLFVVVALVCFQIGMQWGGVTKRWSSVSVIVVLIVALLSIVIFVGLEIWQKERSLLIPRLLKNRNTATLCSFIFFLNGANFLFLYYLPIYFQSIYGMSASQSGVRNIPLIGTTSIVSAVLGAAISVAGGYYLPFMIASGLITTTGAALIFTLDIGSSAGQYLGYQAVIGVGLGLGVQVPMIATQALSDPADMAPNTAIVLFFQLIGGALFVSAAEGIFANRLLQSVAQRVPGLGPAAVLHAGASDIRGAFSAADAPGVFASYMIGLKAAWALGVALAATAAIVSFAPQNKSINAKRAKSG